MFIRKATGRCIKSHWLPQHPLSNCKHSLNQIEFVFTNCKHYLQIEKLAQVAKVLLSRSHLLHFYLKFYTSKAASSTVNNFQSADKKNANCNLRYSNASFVDMKLPKLDHFNDCLCLVIFSRQRTEFLLFFNSSSN